MNVGNKWYYNSYNIHENITDTIAYNESLEILDKIFFDNKIFYLFEDIYYSDNKSVKSIDTIYYAIKNDSLFQINNSKLAKSSISFMGLFSEKPYGNFIVRKDTDGDYMGYVYNYSDTTFTFYYYRDRWMDSGWQMTFKKNIGFVESHPSAWSTGTRIVKYTLK